MPTDSALNLFTVYGTMAWEESGGNRMDEQKSVNDFKTSLLSEATPDIEETSVKPLQYGVFKGKIKVPESFDDPVPAFADYM